VGAYGIDGSLSTFMGQAAVHDGLAFMLLGDLSFFYDMNALQIRHVGSNVRVMVINNEGGAEFVYFLGGKEKVPTNKAVIYTPNHSGAFDIPAVILNAPAPPMFMAKKELSKLPILKNWMEVLDCVFVDRSNKSSAHSSLHDAIEKVKTGRSLVVFPEGTRSKTGELGEFRGGAMKIAMETGATIVPVLIEGSRERLEETGNITPGTVYVTFLDPIETEGMTKEEFFEMPPKLRAMIQAERDRRSVEKEA
jgi:1-acyl-sn-glycerol-3-phosphate acyltransferase